MRPHSIRRILKEWALDRSHYFSPVLRALGSLRTFKLKELMLLLVAVGIAGVVGGVCYYATDVLRVHGGWRRTVANVDPFWYSAGS